MFRLTVASRAQHIGCERCGPQPNMICERGGDQLPDIYQGTFEKIAELVGRHSPSGSEDEIDYHLVDVFNAIGVNAQRDAVGNLIVHFPGSVDGALAITAHKDEIGGIVTRVEDGGRVQVKRLGSAYPWVYGEGIVDLLGEHETVSGVLSFGSRHVSSASPQSAFKESAPIRWSDAWIETKRSTSGLEEAGVRPGTRMVIGKHRKAPFRLGEHIAAYGLDNKASLAVLIELAKRIKRPVHDIYLVATAKEEPGAVGALYLSQRHRFDAMIALEVAPVAAEYGVREGPVPVLFAEDSHGLYDEPLNNSLRGLAHGLGIETQTCIFSGFGSDASICAKHGHIPRAACIGFPAQNTHGYEIAHLGAFENILRILEKACAIDL